MNSPMPVNPEKASAWGECWDTYYASRWYLDAGSRKYYPIESVARAFTLDNETADGPRPRVLALDNASVAAIAALERDINGQQLSALPGKEET